MYTFRESILPCQCQTSSSDKIMQNWSCCQWFVYLLQLKCTLVCSDFISNFRPKLRIAKLLSNLGYLENYPFNLCPILISSFFVRGSRSFSRLNTWGDGESINFLNNFVIHSISLTCPFCTFLTTDFFLTLIPRH